MITLFHGDDSFESYLAAKAELSKVSKETHAEIKIVQLDETTIDQFELLTNAVGLFSSAQIIFGKRLYVNTPLVNHFAENLEKISTHEIILWEQSKADGKRSLTKKLQKAGRLKTFLLPKSWNMSSWVTMFAKKMGFKLPHETVELLVSRFETDKWQIAQELKKISLFVKSHTGESLNHKELEPLISGTESITIWKVIEAFSSRNRVQLVHAFSQFTAFEPQTQLLIALLHKELMNMFSVLDAKSNGISPASLGLHPFVLKKTITNASKFTLSEIAHLADALLACDVAIKNGALETAELFSFLLASTTQQ